MKDKSFTHPFMGMPGAGDAEERMEPCSRGNRNFQKELDAVLCGLSDTKECPRLFLHCCCAPCSSYVLEYLSAYLAITCFFYNPNISPEEEYRKREKELEAMIRKMHTAHPVELLSGNYEPERFYRSVKGLEHLPEGQERCRVCYALRMRESAMLAAEGGYDYFTTTLSISPLKNARWINEIGEALEKEYGVRHLPSDFKKRGGYQRSIELSREYGLYRQNFCGCVFSKTNGLKSGKENAQPGL